MGSGTSDGGGRSLEDVWNYIDQHADRYLDILRQLCRSPSISATGEGVNATADLVERLVRQAGFTAKFDVVSRYPIIFGEAGSGSTRVTLGFYNHYDVQPPDPLEEWASDPFAAEIREERIWSRGVADNKGNLAARLCAFQAYLTVRGRLPLRVIWVLEGEEEIGSPGLASFAQSHEEWMKEANAFIWEGGFNQDGRLVAYLGLKGILYVELHLKEDRTDQHSMFGGVIPNPLWRLTHALASLKGPDEEIRIKGFFDDVASPTPQQRMLLENLVEYAEKALVSTGVTRFVKNLRKQELVERYLFAPTCNIAGWRGGYSGEGMKTVLPASGTVKIDFRLVPQQTPEKVLSALRNHLEQQGFCDVQIRVLSMGHPWVTSPDSVIVQAVRRVAKMLWEGEPVFYPILPGSGPMYDLCGRFTTPCIAGPGVGHPSMQIHGPNENIFVSDYVRAIKGIAALLEVFSTIGDG